MKALRSAMVAIICALALLFAVVPAHAVEGARTTPATAIEAVFAGNGDNEPVARRELMPCHGSGHFCGNLAPLRQSTVAICPSCEGPPVTPDLAPVHALAPGPSELPSEPPRT